MNILVDTNVLVRIAKPADPQRDLAVSAMRFVVNHGHIPTIVPQVAYEFWSVATRPIDDNGLGLPEHKASEDLEKFETDFLLLPDVPEIFNTWKQLVVRGQVRGKVAHDARLVSAMICHSITHFITFNDGHFKRFAEIVAVNPLNVATIPPAGG